VHGGVRIMADAEQQDFGIELIGAPDRAVESVRNIDRMGRSDFGGMRANGREGVGTVAAAHAWHAPERIGDDSHAGAWRSLRNEGLFVIVAHAGHDHGAVRARGHAQRRDEVGRRTGPSAESGEGSMYDEHAVAAHSQGDQLVGDAFSETHRRLRRFL
jgi:hypothetical protein